MFELVHDERRDPEREPPMNAPHVNIGDFGMDTISLGRDAAGQARRRSAMPGSRRSCCRRATWSGTPTASTTPVQAVRASGLRVTGFQVLRDFEGLSGHLHDYKIDIAKSMLEMCARARRHRAAGVLVDVDARDRRPRCAGARPAQARDAGAAARHQGRLRRPVLGPHDQRVHRRLGHRAAAPTRPTSASASTRTTSSRPSRRSTTSTCCRRRRSSWCSSRISCGRRVRTDEERIATARHFRVFPGEGVHSAALRRPRARGSTSIGYRGDYSFEVFNDDYQQMPLDTVAARRAPLARFGWARTCSDEQCPCPTGSAYAAARSKPVAVALR